MPIDLLLIDVSSFPLARAERLMKEGVVRSVRLQLAGNTPAVIQANRKAFPTWRQRLGEVWAWWPAGKSVEEDKALVNEIRGLYQPAGWCLNVEKWAEGRSLSPLAEAVNGDPVIWNLGGFPLPELAGLDFRSMLTIPRSSVEWQCYVGSGEGPTPRQALRSLVRPRILWAAGRGPAWHYRALVGPKGDRRYRWARALNLWDGRFWLEWVGGLGGVAATTDNWVVVVTDPRRVLVDKNGQSVGHLLGLAPYQRLRVCLWQRGLSDEQLYQLAQEARLPRCRPRPVALFAPETASDDLLRGLALITP